MRQGDIDEALIQLSDAATLMERSFVYLPKSKTYKTLLLHLGEAQLSNDLKKDAKKSFARAVLMGAKAKWAPLEANALALFKKVKKAVHMRPSGTIEVIAPIRLAGTALMHYLGTADLLGPAKDNPG